MPYPSIPSHPAPVLLPLPLPSPAGLIDKIPHPASPVLCCYMPFAAVPLLNDPHT